MICSIPCQECTAMFVGETGRRLGTRLHEYQLAVNRKDKLSLVYDNVQQKNHTFAFEKARVIGRANAKMARLLLESWSSTGTLNRAMDLHSAYEALRRRLTLAQNGAIGRAERDKQGAKPSAASKEGGNAHETQKQLHTAHEDACEGTSNSNSHRNRSAQLIDTRALGKASGRTHSSDANRSTDTTF
ncbi:unnamed protein product [Dibothriocephalus latus]|uniref:Uncharacterized protein n=1 Tax=Dibothriocephalus latus TaxID=60516 RepID=A0A3P7P1J0_DIBLA|nr:unnamed protein product [Dibothriocephalus latus]